MISLKNSTRRAKSLLRQAFTLVELLTVMAITAIMMTVIIIPVVQSFNLMRAGQYFSDAQQKAAQLVERIGREIGQAAAVRDNGGIRGSMAVVLPGQNGAPERILLPFSKIDLLLPAEGEPMRGPSGALVNPFTGKEDPTLRAPKGQVVLPVSQGSTVVRWFIGRRNPFAQYNNPYDGLLMARNAQQDNLYVLYRAEVNAWVYSQALGRFVVNKQLFLDLGRDSDPTTSGPWFDDPDFFDPNIPLPAYSNPDPDPSAGPDPSKAQMIQNWLNRATVVTEVSRYDMIQTVFNKQNRAVEYIGNVPRVYSLIQFRPTSVSNEPADSMTAVRLGDESEGMERFSSDVFRTKMGSWSSVVSRYWPMNGALPWQPGQAYEVLRADPSGVAPGLSVYAYDPTSGQPDTSSGVELFDGEEYARSVRDGLAYPFTRAILAANGRSAWLSNVNLRNGFVPFYPIPSTGKIVASFGLNEYGTGPVATDPTEPFPNQNVQHMNTGPALTPTNDTTLPGTFSDPQYSPSNGGGPGWQDPTSGSSINKNFNKIWQYAATTSPDFRPNVHRFIDLRVGTMRDGSPSPLNPDPTLGFARARIVPGSEIVIGPDQNPGPNYGRLVRYTRTTRTPGPNQYRINYTDLREPTNPTTGLVDYVSTLGFPSNPPAAYDPNNFMSAIIQPRYKAGYIQLNSDPNVPLPGDDDPATPANEANISVFYRFQMTAKDDAIAVDYDTSQLLQVLLTVKNYPQTTLPNAQSVTLKATANVRNILR